MERTPGKHKKKGGKSRKKIPKAKAKAQVHEAQHALNKKLDKKLLEEVEQAVRFATCAGDWTNRSIEEIEASLVANLKLKFGSNRTKAYIDKFDKSPLEEYIKALEQLKRLQINSGGISLVSENRSPAPFAWRRAWLESRLPVPHMKKEVLHELYLALQQHPKRSVNIHQKDNIIFNFLKTNVYKENENELLVQDVAIKMRDMLRAHEVLSESYQVDHSKLDSFPTFLSIFDAITYETSKRCYIEFSDKEWEALLPSGPVDKSLLPKVVRPKDDANLETLNSNSLDSPNGNGRRPLRGEEETNAPSPAMLEDALPNVEKATITC